MSTSIGRTVFVLGRELHGNRNAIVVENGAEYDVNFSSVELYTDQTARFPYDI